MKKTKNNQRKLSKKELKEISGGAAICPVGLCKYGDGEYRIGGVNKNGYCCGGTPV